MAKKAKAVAPRPKQELFPGVGFNSEDRTKLGSILVHYIVIMQSVVDGVTIYGPFLTEDAAHRWICTEGAVELWQRYETSNPPGVSFYVTNLHIPTLRSH
jgi:hypothetical protein